MKILQLWYFSCLVFVFLSLETLVEESYEVIYEKGNDTEPVQFLVCLELRDLRLNQTEIDLDELRSHLYNYLNRSEDPFGWRSDHPNEFERLLLNRTRSGGYLLFNARVCFVAYDEVEFEHIGLFLPSKAEYFAIKRDTLDFTPMTFWFNKIEQLAVKRFFFLDMKCFRLEIDQEYGRDQFHFSTGNSVLKVNFTKAPGQEMLLKFMSKSRETVKFSKIVNLSYQYLTDSRFWFFGFSITHETCLYEYEDRFSFIRKRFRSFRDEGDLQGLLLELQGNEHNLRTLNLPLEDGAFDLEVEEDLFQQLYSAESTKHRRTDLNYQQTFVYNHLKEIIDSIKPGPDFTFNLVFLQKIVSSSNEENLGQLILDLLNVLFIWFDLGPLDLHLHLHLPLMLFDKINQFLFFTYKCLKKLKALLDEFLARRRQNSVHPNVRRSRRF